MYPDNDLDYAGNFLGMMYKMTELKYQPDPRLERALDVLFILHADHEQNASTSAVRSVGSTQVDPYSAVAAGVAALYGPLHGGANEQALRMLARIGTVENIPDFLEGVKAGNERLMGFGHRVYKNYDPRARIIRKYLDDVFEVRGKSPLLDVATELEKRALDDEYFTSRKLYPNVDFYSGLIYEALGLPVAMFPVMFAIGRTSRMDRAVEGDGRGLRAEDRPPAPDLHRRARRRLRADRSARLSATAPASPHCAAATRGPRASGASGARRAPRTVASGRGSPGGTPRARRRSRARSRAPSTGAS